MQQQHSSRRRKNVLFLSKFAYILSFYMAKSTLIIYIWIKMILALSLPFQKGTFYPLALAPNVSTSK